jgi:hypothetical protein
MWSGRLPIPRFEEGSRGETKNAKSNLRSLTKLLCLAVTQVGEGSNILDRREAREDEES